MAQEQNDENVSQEELNTGAPSEAEAAEKDEEKNDAGTQTDAPDQIFEETASSEQNDRGEDENTVGALLRRTRMAKNEDLRDIASFLCIRYRFLSALEESKFKELPGEAYANGFIRSYAAYLGLNPADIITRYKQEYFNAENRENGFYVMSAEEAENIVPTPKIVIVSIVLLLIAFGIWRSSSETKEQPVPAVQEQVEPITAVDRSDQASVKDDTANKTSTTVDKKLSAPIPPVPSVKPEFVENGKSEKTETADENTAVGDNAENGNTDVTEEKKDETDFHEPRIYGQKNYNPRLVLIAKEKVWIEITRGNTVVFSRLLDRGDQYMVSSKNPEGLYLKTGNAGGLDIYCDGRLTQSLGPRGALISNIALIPDDFAAKVVEDIE